MDMNAKIRDDMNQLWIDNHNHRTKTWQLNDDGYKYALSCFASIEETHRKGVDMMEQNSEHEIFAMMMAPLNEDAARINEACKLTAYIETIVAMVKIQYVNDCGGSK